MIFKYINNKYNLYAHLFLITNHRLLIKELDEAVSDRQIHCKSYFKNGIKPKIYSRRTQYTYSATMRPSYIVL